MHHLSWSWWEQRTRRFSDPTRCWHQIIKILCILGCVCSRAASCYQITDHQWDTKTIFDEVEKEAREYLGGVKTLLEKYQVMKNLGELEETVFVKGAKLGSLLETMTDHSTRWKVIADFWSEMILFVSPSENVRGHIERLTHGGEFITHLWALLTHPGIVEPHKEKQNV